MSIVWQRVVGSAFVWVRPDDVVAVDDELIDLATGRVREEPPWPFLDMQPWSRQSWEPRIVGVGEQGPGTGCDKVEARRWRDLLVVGRSTTDVVRWTDHGMLVEARHISTGETAWQHHAARCSGSPTFSTSAGQGSRSRAAAACSPACRFPRRAHSPHRRPVSAGGRGQRSYRLSSR